MIDTYQKRIAEKKRDLQELYSKPRDEQTRTRKGGGYTYSTVGEKIQKFEKQIETWNGKINEYRQRWSNVNTWSSGGAHDVIRTATNRYWRGKRYQKPLGAHFMEKARKSIAKRYQKPLGAHFMEKARKSIASAETKRFVRDKFLKWIQSKVEECKK